MARTDKKIRIFSALEVANICGVVNQTAINWIKNGYLKAFTTPGGQYRVYAEDLIEFLSSRGMRLPVELQKMMEEIQSLRTILIVDDDQALNDSLKKGLEMMDPDLTILQATDGFEAGRVSVEYKPNLIILDIDLPGVDGFKLCKTFKADDKLANPIIIAISGMGVEDTESKAMDAGADAFMAKPINFDDLAGKIKELQDSRD
jgi:two-component system OmpR family response regulator